MLRLLPWFLIALVIVVCLAIFFYSRETLPVAMPEDFHITYSHNEGEVPDSENYDLRMGTSTATIHRGVGEGQTYTFHVTTTDMEELYTIMREQRVATIRTMKGGMEHDAPETNLTIAWGDQEITLRNGATTRVVESADDRFFAIAAALDAFVQAKIVAIP